jgi:hypothetical protein
LDRYIIVQRYASAFLEQEEAEALKKKSKREYYGDLADAAIRLRESAFWRYHAAGLKTLGERIQWAHLALAVGRLLVWLVINPGVTGLRLLRSTMRPRRDLRLPSDDPRHALPGLLRNHKEPGSDTWVQP